MDLDCGDSDSFCSLLSPYHKRSVRPTPRNVFQRYFLRSVAVPWGKESERLVVLHVSDHWPQIAQFESMLAVSAGNHQSLDWFYICLGSHWFSFISMQHAETRPAQEKNLSQGNIYFDFIVMQRELKEGSVTRGHRSHKLVGQQL